MPTEALPARRPFAFEDISVTPQEHALYEWTLTTREVADGLGVEPETIRSCKSRNPGELIEGKHWLTPVADCNGGTTSMVWTKRGVIRLGFLITSDRARRFRDFAEDIFLDHVTTATPQVLSPRDLLALQLQVMDELAARTTAVEISQRVLADEQAFTSARLEQVAAKQDRRDPAEDEMVPVTVTTIGSMLVPLAAGARVNKLMQEAGLQWHQNGRWVPTHEGRQYAVIIPVQHASGRWHESLQWQKRVVPVLERRLARRATLRSVS